MRTRLHTTRQARRAVTLTELLVVLAIIGLLATILIPVYLNKMETAKIRTAQQECQEIAQAMEQCAIFHSFYVPIQLLDDLPRDTANVNTGNPPADSLDNESWGNIWLIDPFRDPILQAAGTQYRMDSNIPRVVDLREEWQGPFLNAQRVFKDPLNPTGTALTDVRRDFPMDPWGQPYRFFSPVGPIGTNALQRDPFQQNSDTFSDGWMQDLDTADPFDRYAIVSFGPDQDLNQAFDPFNDDIFYEFGMVFVPTRFYRYYK